MLKIQPFMMNIIRFLILSSMLLTPLTGYAALQDNGNGTVTDIETGLMWQQDTAASGKMTWDAAIQYCENLTLAGYSDWRLPNIKELRSIVDYSTYDPSIDTNMFNDTMSSYYWSATTYAGNTVHAWYINFNYGNDNYNNKSNSYYVRAVRSGHLVTGSFDPLVISVLATPSTGYAPFTTSLSVSVSKGTPPYTYSWNFGDSSASGTLQNISHEYTSPGTYTAAVTVTDANNTTKTESVTVTVTEKPNTPPQASIVVNGPASGTAPMTVSFTAQASDADGTIISHDWDFGDGTAPLSGAALSSAEHTFTAKGIYSVQLTVTDDKGGITMAPAQQITVSNAVVDPDPTPDPDPQPTGPGAAIIIAGGGNHQSNTLFPYTEKNCNYFYTLLKSRGFSHDTIFYLNPKDWQDINGDGSEDKVVDYTLFDPDADLAAAFDSAAALLTADSQFVLYIHGHSRQESLTMKQGSSLSADTLNSYLGRLPVETRKIIIIDTCYSGSFFDNIKGTNRILISSSDSSSTAWNPLAGETFSDRLIRQLWLGSSLTEAFQSSEMMIISDKDSFGDQKPWLDDNYDGIYSSADGPGAGTVLIGMESLSQAEPSVITQVHDRIELKENEAATDLWVKTFPVNEGINKVTAILKKPGFELVEYAGDETDFAVIELEMLFNPAKQRYEVVYDAFRDAGTWKILYQAQGEDGAWSEPAHGEVISKGVGAEATVVVNLNQSVYKVGDNLQFNVTVNGNSTTDLYVAIIFPGGFFLTIKHPLEFSWPNAIEVYKKNLVIAGEKAYSIFNVPLPQGIEKGTYSCFAMVTKNGSDPWNGDNWIFSDMKSFKMQ